jgi:hypothetical protein
LSLSAKNAVFPRVSGSFRLVRGRTVLPAAGVLQQKTGAGVQELAGRGIFAYNGTMNLPALKA